MDNERDNKSSTAIISRRMVFAEGTFKIVYAGTYTNGPRKGQKCIAKEFKTGSHVLLNMSQIWVNTNTSEKSLVEPMIENFEKFNSNSGWADITGGMWSEAMQALSHYSYDNSGGQLLLCDIQGGSYSNGYILSDPVIMSQRRTYGPTDLGRDGIRSFFLRHTCNRFCKQHWTKPARQGRASIPMTRGTTMAPRLPTRVNRNPLSLSRLERRH
ncbi:kinase-like domain-containing protein [Astrocystis sublimbata]|nr:kinase-like domain-containing protein [Astrocystis sublimbata]KAI0200271.1 kinase-like domain-containing protein [Astrocystis sublimbata]